MDTFSYRGPYFDLKKSKRPVDALALKKSELVTDLQFQIKRC